MTRRPQRILLIGLGVFAIAGAGVLLVIYQQRQVLGARMLEAYLKRHGVPAAIRIDRLGLDGASGAMRLGPPAEPDLFAPQVILRFSGTDRLSASQPPRIRAVELSNPTLRARWRNGRFDFGTLQGLIEPSARGQSAGPAPDIVLHNGHLLLGTPAGLLVLGLDGALPQGRLKTLDVRLLPGDLRTTRASLLGAHGVLSVRRKGADRLAVSGSMSAVQLGVGGARLAAPSLHIDASIPDIAAPASAGTFQPVTGVLRLQALRASTASAKAVASSATGVDAWLKVDGRLDRTVFYAGKATAGLGAKAFRTGRLSLGGLRIDLGSSGLSLRQNGGRLVGAGPFALTASAAAGQAQAPYGAIRLTGLGLSARGTVRQGAGVHLQATGSVFGTAAPGPALAAALRPLDRTAPATAKALADALMSARLDLPSVSVAFDGGRAWSVRLDRGATVALAAGEVTARPLGSAAILAFSPARGAEGAVRLSARVRGLPQLDASFAHARWAKGAGLSSDFDLRARGDVEAVREAALNARGAITGRGRSWTLHLADCATASAEAVGAEGQPVATRVRGDVCPTGSAPLLALTAGGWRAAARLQALELSSPTASARMSAPDLSLNASGHGADFSGEARFAGVAVMDDAKPRRFEPVTLQGVASLAARAASGRIELADRRARLGTLSFRSDLASGQGRAVFDSGRLNFATQGLRLSDIAPALATAMPQAKGTLRLQARADWTRSGLGSSSGELQMDGFGFKTGAGQLSGLHADVALSSLTPLESEPRQTITAERLDALLPLTHLAASFTLAPGTLHLYAASAELAGGRATLDPMTLPLGGGLAGTSGTLHLKAIDLQRVLAVFNLSNAVTIEARVGGALPFSLAAAPAGAVTPRIDHGRLYAEGPGRLTIQRGALGGAIATAGGAGTQPGAVQDFAYQALEDLAFTTLQADLASRSGGRLGAVLHVVGRHDPKQDRPTRIGLWALLRGHAFDKPLPLPKGTPIDLTLDTSLNLDDLLAQYGAMNAHPGSASVQP